MSFRLWKPGDRPGRAGQYEERGPFGECLSSARRITLRNSDGQLPATTAKGHRWKLVGGPASTGAIVISSAGRPLPIAPHLLQLVLACLVVGIGGYATFLAFRAIQNDDAPLLAVGPVLLLLVAAPITSIALLAVVFHTARALLDSEQAKRLGDTIYELIRKAADSTFLSKVSRTVPTATVAAATSLPAFTLAAHGPSVVFETLNRVSQNVSTVVSAWQPVTVTAPIHLPEIPETSTARLEQLLQRLVEHQRMEWELTRMLITSTMREPPVVVEVGSERQRPPAQPALQGELERLRRTTDQILLLLGREDTRAEVLRDLRILGVFYEQRSEAERENLAESFDGLRAQLASLEEVAERGVSLEEERDRRNLVDRTQRLLDTLPSVNQRPIADLPEKFDLYYNATLDWTNLQEKDGYKVRCIKLSTDDLPRTVMSRWPQSPNNDVWSRVRIDDASNKDHRHDQFKRQNRVIDVWTGKNGSSTEILLEFAIDPARKPPKPMCDERFSRSDAQGESDNELVAGRDTPQSPDEPGVNPTGSARP